MRKIIAFIICAFFLFTIFPISSIYANDKNYFVVTAYYSPLPNQKYYMKGNLEAEKRLQGHGIRGASGAPVFSGMVAAPKKYSFGTKVYIEGLGVGNIQDRGGAIVQAGKRGYSYDRLDVWMGYGDEGLKRALAWGKRTVPGYVVSSDSTVTINYKNHPAPDWAVKSLKQSSEAKNITKSTYVKQTKKDKTVYDYSLGVGSSIEKVKQLQKLLQSAELYKGEIDGLYNAELIAIISKFQLQNDIIQDFTDEGAGYWGPKTRNMFQKQYTIGELNITKKTSEEIFETPNINEISIFSSYSGSSGEHKEILSMLSDIGLYDGEIEVSKQDFINIIYKFQLETGILTSPSDIGAGYFGPKTRVKLKERYDIFLEKLEKTKNIISVVKKIGNLKEGEKSDSVGQLQELLYDLGYFEQKPTGYFGPITSEAVTKFQLENGLIDGAESKYAGIVGDRTLETLGTEYYSFINQSN